MYEYVGFAEEFIKLLSKYLRDKEKDFPQLCCEKALLPQRR
jgi:hypothetical protein